MISHSQEPCRHDPGHDFTTVTTNTGSFVLDVGPSPSPSQDTTSSVAEPFNSSSGQVAHQEAARPSAPTVSVLLQAQ